MMDFNYKFRILPIISSFVCFLLLCSMSMAQSEDFRRMNQTFRPGEESKKMRLIRNHLMKINKPSVKTIQSPDGDIIDCVIVHDQLAFDHPLLKGTKPLDPPERPNGYHHHAGIELENYQLWSLSGESCPEGTIPIRRTTEADILRASSIQKFGTKSPTTRLVRDDGGIHEHAAGMVSGEPYYGVQAIIDAWSPKVTAYNEFSLTQLWVMSGTFGVDVNTIEVGWQVFPVKYGDYSPRFFIYWTSDDYRSKGCYNLECSGFVQTNNKIAVGSAIPTWSIYNGQQYDISILVWKDPKQGNWWLEFGGNVVGYWPASLFTNLREHATTIEFGGEIVNSQPSGSHTTTQMGSGHFAGEGYRKASYIRNVKVIDRDFNLIPLPNMAVSAETPNCYNVIAGINEDWGNYIYYGGPGKNERCP